MFLSKSNLKELNRSNFEYRIAGNSGFILKKKLTPRSKFLNKPILRLLPRKKIKSLYKVVV